MIPCTRRKTSDWLTYWCYTSGAGTTAAGEPYRSNDPELLNSVYASTASGFVQGYHTYVQPLSSLERKTYYAEGVPAAALLRRDQRS
jgi:uncharacterized protein (DUF2236 family)